jgi:cytochrome c553
MRIIRGTGWGLILGSAAVLLMTGCASERPEQPPPLKGVVSLNDIMVSVVDHNSHILWNVAEEKNAPKNDADWHVLEHAAVTLAAAGNMILIGGTGKDDAAWVKDPEWRKHAQEMETAALKAVNAVDHQDKNALLAAGDDLVATCESCHKKFKPALPAHVAKPAEQPEHYHKGSTP